MGQSSGTSQGTTTQQLTPEQQNLVNLAMPGYQAFGTAGAPPVPTGNQAVAPFNAAQTQGQGQVLGAAAPGGPMSNLINTAGGETGNLASGSLLDVGNNPVVQNAVNATIAPIQRNLQQQTLPQLSSASTVGAGGPSANAGGSREGIAEGLASQGATLAEQQAAANVVAPAYSSGLSGTLQALGLAPQMAGTYALPGATTSAVGDVQQQQAQNVLNANNSAAMMQYMWPLIQAQALTQGAEGLPGGTVQSSGQTTQQAAPWQIAAGLGAAAGSLMGGGGGAGGGAGGLTGLLNYLSPQKPA